MSKLVERVVTAGTHTGADGHLTRTHEVVMVTPKEAERFKDKLRDPRTAEESATEQEELKRQRDEAVAASKEAERELGAAREDLAVARARIEQLEAGMGEASGDPPPAAANSPAEPEASDAVAPAEAPAAEKPARSRKK